MDEVEVEETDCMMGYGLETKLPSGRGAVSVHACRPV
jgi:hypothetical protein